MLPPALAFLAGICLLFSCHRSPAIAGLLAVALTAGVCLCLPRLRLAAFLLAGFTWAGWHTLQLSALQLPAELEGRDLLVRGQVAGLPEQLAGDRVRLRLNIDSYRADADWQALALPVRLNWYQGAPAIQPGERWQLQVRLKAAHGFANPGGFDYQRWLFAHRLRATGYVRKAAANRRLLPATVAGAQQLRYRLSRYLQARDLPASGRALLRALAIGDRGGMTRPQWDLLQQTGTSHLLAISGLHVGLVAGLVFWGAARLWALLGAARLWPAPRAAALAAMFAALVYALLAGFEVPAQRALIMVWVWMLSILLGVRGRPWQVWALALSLVLLHEPLSVLTAGFWLSFSAVALILFLGHGRYGGNARLRPLLVLQLGLTAGLTPVLWSWFQQASLVAPLANLVAIPAIGFVIVPLLLAGLALLPVSPAVTDGLLSAAAAALEVLWRFLQWLDPGNSQALWHAPSLSPFALALFTGGLLLALLPRGSGIRGLAAIILLPVLAAAPRRPVPGELWMTLLDVGQGLAVVVETRRHVLVYDTGPAFPGGFDTGKSVLIPFLQQRGYRQLDRLVISHSDNDHSGGGRSLNHRYPASRVDAGEPRLVRWVKAADCHAQPPWQWDGIRFGYLPTPAPASGNNASCVLKITTPDGRGVLLPGDIERSVEAVLLAGSAVALAADVLVAPHHGSRSSSTPAFIHAVDPDWVLFATGYRNRFGFPRPGIVTRYQAAGVRRMNSATAGAIEVRIGARQGVRVSSWRQHHRRLWRH